MEIELKVALISAGVSAVVFLISIFLDPLKERIAHIFKLKSEHKYEQKKEIKKVLSKYKVQLLNSAEALNQRLLNMRSNYKWLDINGGGFDDYYFKSFIYRFLAFYFWINKAESEMIFLDTSIASKEDLVFIKFLKLFNKVFCDATLITQVDKNYSTFKQTDHFFANNFNSICLECHVDSKSFPTFEDFVVPKTYLSNYIDGINPFEDRYRWDLIQMFHYLIISFLNTYGYDFQRISDEETEKLIFSSITKPILHSSFESLISKYGLSKQKELRRIIKKTKMRANSISRT